MPGFWDDIVLIDSTPIETARSRETVKPAGSSRLGDAIAAAYGYCPSHSRWFFGMRLHGVFGLDGTPRAVMLVGADRPEREVALQMLPAALRGGETLIGDKNYAGRQFAADVAALGATLVRPPRQDEPQTAPRTSKLRQRIPRPRARTDTRRVPRDEIPVTHARGRCVVEHLAVVRAVLGDGLRSTVTIDVTDAALERAGRA